MNIHVKTVRFVTIICAIVCCYVGIAQISPLTPRVENGLELIEEVLDS